MSQAKVLNIQYANNIFSWIQEMLLLEFMAKEKKRQYLCTVLHMTAQEKRMPHVEVSIGFVWLDRDSILVLRSQYPTSKDKCFLWKTLLQKNNLPFISFIINII